MYRKTLTELLKILLETNTLKPFHNIAELRTSIAYANQTKLQTGFKRIERYLDYDFEYGGLYFDIFGKNYSCFQLLEQNELFHTSMQVYQHIEDEKTFIPLEQSQKKRLRQDQYYHLRFKLNHRKYNLTKLFQLLHTLAENYHCEFVLIGKQQDLFSNFYLTINRHGLNNQHAYFRLFKSDYILEDCLFSLILLAYSFDTLKQLYQFNISFLITDKQLTELYRSRYISYDFCDYAIDNPYHNNLRFKQI